MLVGHDVSCTGQCVLGDCCSPQILLLLCYCLLIRPVSKAAGAGGRCTAYTDNKRIKEFYASPVLQAGSAVSDLLEQKDENALFILQTS